MAESGTPEKSFPYKEFVGAVREHLGESVPDIKEANARYSTRTGGLERVKGAVYGDPDLHNLGTSTAPGPLDVPEAGAPLVQQRMPPQDEARGAMNLVKLQELSMAGGAKSPQIKDLVDNGFGPELELLRQRLDGVKQMTFETQQKHDDAVAAVEADTQRKLLELRRQLGGETDKVLESKVAQEASKFRLGSLVHPVTLAALGATTHSPAHALSLEGLAAEKIGGRISQPVASGIASFSQRAKSQLPGLTLPGFMGMATASASRAPGSGIVDQAREHAEKAKRFGASIGSIIRAKEEREAQ